MESIFQEYLERGIKTYLRGDSGFSSPKLYETCESNGCSYAIRLKQNPALIALASDKEEDLYQATQKDQIIQFYCGRGKMENFIKESKSEFDFAAVSSHSKIVNANRMRLHMLAYNLFNWFRRLVLPASMRKQQVDTIRLKLIKIAARAIHSARSITFKLCSSCPYKKEFYRTLANIHQLFVQLE